MRKFAHWQCFGLVALTSVLSHSGWLLHHAGIKLPFQEQLHMLMWFGSLVPPVATLYVPSVAMLGISWMMLLLVIRRLWLLIVRHEALPRSFSGIPVGLALIGAWSFLAGLVGVLVSQILWGHVGVVNGLIALPAVVCVPWAFFLAEIASIRRGADEEAPEKMGA